MIVSFLFVSLQAKNNCAAMLLAIGTSAQTLWGDMINKLKVEARADGELFTTDSTPNFGFHGKYFNLMLGGNLGDHFSYYFKQRVVANGGSVMFFDNTDFLYLDYRPTANWRLRFGKDAMAMGGFEYDASPIDVYFPTTLSRRAWPTMPAWCRTTCAGTARWGTGGPSGAPA